MVIATRILKLRTTDRDTEIPVRIFAPKPQALDWACTVEIDWPDGTVTMDAAGIDAVQALELGLKLVGAQLYASDHHASGRLMWQEPGKGYGFPVVNSLRDMLIGDDKRFL
ncbi:MAG: DUF6968 family protein [Pseudorhodoplanes sp.]